ncbi:hypothetical protein B0H13DRAFT_1932187 [Mycena leptocephala]|nr:hypothetical protein B0H13DRAFT_1932187 [Mycena leptocephala]
MILVCPARELSLGSSFGARSSRQTPLHARELGDGTLPLSSWTVVILCLLHSVASSLVHSKWVKTKLSPLVGITCKIGAVQAQGLRSDDEFMDLATSILWLNEGEWICFRSTSIKSSSLFPPFGFNNLDLIVPLGLVAAVASRARVAIAMSWQGCVDF